MRLPALILPFLVYSLLALVSCSNEPSAVRVVDAYQAAVNEENLAVLESLYTVDCVFELEGQWRKIGWDQISNLAEWDTTVNTRVTVTVDSTEENVVYARIDQSNDWLTGYGIDTIHYVTEFVTRGEQISSIRTAATPESRDEFARQWQRVFGYMKMTHPELFRELLPGGEFQYTPEAAKKWLELFEEWQEMQ